MIRTFVSAALAAAAVPPLIFARKSMGIKGCRRSMGPRGRSRGSSGAPSQLDRCHVPAPQAPVDGARRSGGGQSRPGDLQHQRTEDGRPDMKFMNRGASQSFKKFKGRRPKEINEDQSESPSPGGSSPPPVEPSPR